MPQPSDVQEKGWHHVMLRLFRGGHRKRILCSFASIFGCPSAGSRRIFEFLYERRPATLTSKRKLTRKLHLRTSHPRQDARPTKLPFLGWSFHLWSLTRIWIETHKKVICESDKAEEAALPSTSNGLCISTHHQDCFLSLTRRVSSSINLLYCA